MTQVFDSLGWALLHSLWQGSLAMIIVMVFRTFAKKRSPSLRYIVQFLSLLACFVAFLITFNFYQSGGEASAGLKSIPAAQTLSQAAVILTGSSDSFYATSQNLSLSAAATAPMIGLLWCFGFSFMAIRYFTAYTLTQKLRYQGLSEGPVFWQEKFRGLILKTGVPKSVRLFVSTHVSGPLTIGFVKPIVLVPTGFLMGLPQDQVEAILLHELAHIRRYDYLINLLQTAIKTVLFFHPAIHYISRKIDIDREQACDDLAVAQTQDPQSLVRGLAALRLHTSGHSFAMAADDGNSPLMDRLKRLVGSVEHQRRPEHLLMPLMATFLIGGVYLSTTSAANAHPKSTEHVDSHTDKQKYRFETQRLNGRAVTVKITEDGRRWVLKDGSWHNIERSLDVIKDLPVSLPQPPQPPTPPKFTQGDIFNDNFDTKMAQFEIDMEYFEADLERYLSENEHVDEWKRNRIEKAMDRAERQAEHMLDRFESERERSEIAFEREEYRRERAEEIAEVKRERAQERRERAVELEEARREKVEKRRERAQDHAERLREHSRQGSQRHSHNQAIHTNQDIVRAMLYDHLLKDGLITSRGQTVIMRYNDNKWTANGVALPADTDGRYCRIFSDLGIKKTDLSKAIFKPDSMHIISKSGSRSKAKLKSKTRISPQLQGPVHDERVQNNNQPHNVSPSEQPGYYPQTDRQSTYGSGYEPIKTNAHSLHFQRPVLNQKISAKYGLKGSLWPKKHQGIDYGAQTGSPIRASADGVVLKATTDPKWGNRIILKHASGYQTLYAHMDSFVVKAGQQVQAGELIGRVGSTGQSTGPHLHFEIRQNGQTLDPVPLIN